MEEDEDDENVYEPRSVTSRGGPPRPGRGVGGAGARGEAAWEKPRPNAGECHGPMSSITLFLNDFFFSFLS